MAKLLLHKDRLEITLSASERAFSRRSENISIERSAIRSATITEDPWIWVRGVRAPGTAIPLTLAVGRWKFHGGDDFLLLRGRKSAVVIDLTEGEFARVIVSTEHAASLLEALALDTRPRRRRKAEPATEEVRMRQVAPRRVEATRASASDIAALAEYGLEPERHGLVSGLLAGRANRATDIPGAGKSRGLRRLLPFGRHAEDGDQPVEIVAKPAPDQSPTEDSATVKKPSTKPAAAKPAAKKPAATKPAATKPAATKPAAKKPATKKPAATKPAATKPDEATVKPAASKAAPAKATPAKAETAKATPAKATPAKATPAKKASAATKPAAAQSEPKQTGPKRPAATKPAATSTTGTAETPADPAAE